MRFIELHDFEKIVNQSCEDNKLLRKVLEANNIEYVVHVLFKFGLDDDKLDSLLEMNGWKGNDHCAIYYNYIFKGYTPGPSYSSMNTNFCSIMLINKINLEQFINIFRKTMELKVFL